MSERSELIPCTCIMLGNFKGGGSKRFSEGDEGKSLFSHTPLNETLLSFYEGVYSTSDVKHTSAQKGGGPIIFFERWGISGDNSTSIYNGLLIFISCLVLKRTSSITNNVSMDTIN